MSNDILTRIIDWWRSLRAAPTTPPPSLPPARPVAPDILVGPPMIDGDSLRDWMVHHHRRNENVWQQVVAEFYTRAAQDSEIAAYFTGVNMAELQNHFMRALVVVTHIGLTQRSADSLGARHAHLGITREHFNRVADTLVAVLTDYGVPRTGVLQLVPIVDALRPRIVTA